MVSQAGLADDDFDRMSQNGVGLMRVQVSWKKVQPAEGDCDASLLPGVPVPGACDWSYYDRIVGGAAAAGVEVMPYLLTVPEWISKDENTPPIHSDADRAAWTEWLQAAVHRATGRTAASGSRSTRPSTPVPRRSRSAAGRSGTSPPTAPSGTRGRTPPSTGSSSS